MIHRQPLQNRENIYLEYAAGINQPMDALVYV